LISRKRVGLLQHTDRNLEATRDAEERVSAANDVLDGQLSIVLPEAWPDGRHDRQNRDERNQ
jgi:hypothetical protein